MIEAMQQDAASVGNTDEFLWRDTDGNIWLESGEFENEHPVLYRLVKDKADSTCGACLTGICTQRVMFCEAWGCIIKIEHLGATDFE